MNKIDFSKLTYIDLFAGIGGFHQALSSFGAKCVFASEIDKQASLTYFENYGIEPFGDITKISEKDIPKHDILCAGFPCQAFSISGKQLGFDDTRGTLFFEIVRIVNYHNPKIIFLENVKNFIKHDNGRTLDVVVKTLDQLGYNVSYKVLNASDFGLPQNRERVYFLGFRKDLGINNFLFPIGQSKRVALIDFLEDEPNNVEAIQRNDIVINKNFDFYDECVNNIVLPNKPIQIGIVGKGGQGERIYHPLGHAITLSAYGGGVGSKTGLYKIRNNIRKLSPRECARIQGFPDSFRIISSKSQAYQQFGNSVAINVLKAILFKVEEVLSNSGVIMMSDFNHRQLIGSETAKGGFKAENLIVEKFKNYHQDQEATKWLNIMGYDINRIQSLDAVQVPIRLNRRTFEKFGCNDCFEYTQKYKKADVQVQLTILMDNVIYRENISVKKSDANFSQIDKRSVDTYQQMWGFNNDVALTLKKFTGEIVPDFIESQKLRDHRRWYLNELPENQVSKMIDFFEKNKILIVSDILKGRGMLSAEWFLVVRKENNGNYKGILKNINEVINYYSQGDVIISKNGGLILGRLTAQRKGGTPDPTSLQFKIKPLDLFNLD